MNKILSWFCYLFLKPIVKFIFIKEVKGIENLPKSNFILAPNHQSHLDQIAAGYLCVPRKFTYLGQIDKYSGLEALLRNTAYKIAGVIPVHRFNEESKKRAIEECIKRIKKGEILVIYPEGTRSKDGKIGEGKTGIAKIYLKTGIPILPVAFKGTFDLMPVGKSFPKIKRVIKINVGKPLQFQEEFEMAKILDPQSKEYKEICQKITKKVMEEIKKLFENI
jgi:1-acyl-sn-glycerol-3-phosphate acyltransferase